MEKEFNLSEKILPNCRQILSMYHHDKPMALTKDIKEFIKRLKDEIKGNTRISYQHVYLKIIDKLAGDKLI